MALEFARGALNEAVLDTGSSLIMGPKSDLYMDQAVRLVRPASRRVPARTIALCTTLS